MLYFFTLGETHFLFGKRCKFHFEFVNSDFPEINSSNHIITCKSFIFAFN